MPFWAPLIAGVASGAIGAGMNAATSTGGNRVAPGISPGLAAMLSEQSSAKASEWLGDYIRVMESLGRGARRSTGMVLNRFRQGAMGLEGAARGATAEAVREYRDFGKHGMDVLGEEYRRALADAGASSAIRRARGGYTSAAAQEEAGVKGELLYGYNRALNDLTSRRAELVGGAIERGRGRELHVRSANLATELPLMQNTFALPAEYARTLAEGRLQTLLRPELLYPSTNIRANIFGGAHTPALTGQNSNALGNFFTDLGGLAIGRALSSWGNRPVSPQSFGQNPYAGGYGMGP